MSDEEVRLAALMCIDELGINAARLAASQINALAGPSELGAAILWRRVLKEIERLQALEADGGAKH